MNKCRYCQFENEDGALFCEQCKSDLSAAEALPIGEALVEASPSIEIPVAQPMSETIPILAETVTEAPQAIPIVEPIAVTPPEIPAVAVAGAFAATESGVATLSPETMAASPVAPSPIPETPAAEPSILPADAQPRLLVVRGQKRNVEYPLYEGQNYIGRADEKPVDIDLEDQEPPDRLWCSRQHCVINFDQGKIQIEDLNSANGTFVNRSRIYPGKSHLLQINDVIQIGNVQLRVIV